MKILLAGGSGFMGTAFSKSLQSSGHETWILTRRTPKHPHEIQWDGFTTRGWGERVNEMDAIVNMTGYGLEHWPWTKSQKQRFLDSRIFPGLALASAIKNSARRPRVFLQISGINHYGLRGEGIADESTPPADDFLAQLTVKWEDASREVEGLGIRRIVARTAVVLAAHGGLFPLMALPVRLFAGGPLGSGKQAMPWIHVADHVNALRFLLENDSARGVFNLIAPTPISNAEFVRAIAKILHRPYWFPMPAFLLRALLGEMNVLILEGRFAQPKRLLELGYKFRFPNIETALADLIG
ncbi:MAG: TIGR01777 family protein [Chloroflexi bacterium]|nr:TIGR01777 family protein [Chloroflexota bacterium]